MAMAVVYTQFCGMLVHETRNGVDREYLPDPLGSTAALLDSNQQISDSWEYWPYGEVMSRTGTNPTPFTFVGLLGYFQEILDKLTYIRARWYQPGYGRWSTVDPIWPDERAYGYVGNSPVYHLDPLGTCRVKVTGCSDVDENKVQVMFTRLCAVTSNLKPLLDCLLKTNVTCHSSPLGDAEGSMHDCIANACNPKSDCVINVRCAKGSEHYWKCQFPSPNPCALADIQKGEIILCKEFFSKECQPGYCILAHELIHVCSGSASANSHAGAFTDAFPCVNSMPGCENMVIHGVKPPPGAGSL